jgi:hypothetical protein
MSWLVDSVYDPSDEGPKRGRSVRHFKGGGGSTTTTTIPKELRPLAREYTSRALDMADNQFTPYTGQRFAGMTGDQNAALDMIRQRAANGSPVMDQANQTLMNTLQGGNTNPFLDQMVSRAQQSVAENFNAMTKPQTESAMVRSGSFGNSGLQQTLERQQKAAADQMSGIATQMYGNAYNTDRANQMQALGMAPQYGNQAYQDAAQLLNAGGLQQANQQQGLDFQYEQFQDQQNQPYKNLQTLGAPFSLNLGSVTKTSGGGK